MIDFQISRLNTFGWGEKRRQISCKSWRERWWKEKMKKRLFKANGHTFSFFLKPKGLFFQVGMSELMWITPVRVWPLHVEWLQSGAGNNPHCRWTRPTNTHRSPVINRSDKQSTSFCIRNTIFICGVILHPEDPPPGPCGRHSRRLLALPFETN